MFVLYNGEYREQDLSRGSQIKNILDGLVQRKKYLGQQIGDYEITVVDYDFGLHRPINVAKCVHCGQEKNIPDLGDFRRGKGVARLCKCRYKKDERPDKRDPNSYVGEHVNGFEVLLYTAGKGFHVRCIECGKQKYTAMKSVLTGKEQCNHRVTNDYSDPKWIGMRSGSLEAIGRVGKKMVFRCDCGTEVIRRPTDVFRENGGVKSCGRQECEYHRDFVQRGSDACKAGFDFEFECADKMKNQGFEIEMTPSSNDYGVDFFAKIDGERVAFQCKKLNVGSKVGAVQEVYAGGRYYDCSKFVVVSPSGFSYPAKLMASKLGVQLERNLQNFRLKTLSENKIDTQQMVTFSKRSLVWEIDGVVKSADDWCKVYNITRSAIINRMKKQGMDLKTALTTPKHGGRTFVEIDGVTKTKQEWCDEYGISPQLYDYRVKYSGMSPVEALTAPKKLREATP